MALAGLFAVGALVAYAFISGLIKVEISDTEKAEDTIPSHTALPDFRGFDHVFDEEDGEEVGEEAAGVEEEKEGNQQRQDNPGKDGNGTEEK